MKIDVVKKKVEKRIEDLIKEFRKYPKKFLTEEDVRSYLYHLLLKDFLAIRICKDRTKSIPIHCEVRWYGENKSLRLISDIVILDVPKLRTKEFKGLRLPSKGYGFNKFFSLVEIKLRRINGESDNQFIEKINKDRDKISKIREKVGGVDFYSYLIVFDKKRGINFFVSSNEKDKEYYIYPYQTERSLNQ